MADDGSASVLKRENMVAHQIARRGVRDPRVLQAMARVPREMFVEEGYREFAYEDAPLPIAEQQTISQPYIVAAMAEAALLKPTDKVLEVGAGSGYAAAVLAELAARVVTIERHRALAMGARARLEGLGYRNVEVIQGDGTLGRPEAAPFDAILVAAGAPATPEPLKRQLAVGGRLIIPVGESRNQTLRRITRLSETEFSEDNLGRVQFVPLVGEAGWPEPQARSLAERIRAAARPLPDIDAPDFADFIDGYVDGARVILLGEASHGTSEFYRARAAITRRLVERHGFRIVAAEADWPDAAAIDRHVRRRPGSANHVRPFDRFPSWMWRNTEFSAFVDWLYAFNGSRPMADRCAFRGLDLYNLTGSISGVLAYLDRVDPQAAAVARERYGCLTPWQRDPAAYGRAVLSRGYRTCETAVVEQCRDLLQRRLGEAEGDDLLDATQNARLIASAERYYRLMYYGGRESWNLRDRHMAETLDQLLQAGGEGAKAVVWAHNSHIGDARHTEMGEIRDELNLGQLARERYGRAARLIGFGTHGGEVAAAGEWDGPMEVKSVQPSHPDSYERLSHDAGARFVLDLRGGADDALRRDLLAPRLERFIGVIYRPESELVSHYSEASLPQQFDAWVWFDQTHAVTPLGPEHKPTDAPDTWPFGL